MSPALSIVIGGMLGLSLGTGLVLILLTTSPFRRINPAARIDPYLRVDRTSRRRGEAPTARWRVLTEVLLGPIAARGLGVLERLTGDQQQLDRRLRLAGRRDAVDAFRIEQVLCGAAGGLAALGLAVLAVTTRGASPLLGAVVMILGIVGGVVLRDHLLTRQISRRAARMGREFPTVADLLALAVGAGESPVAAMERVARTSSGALPEEFGMCVAQIRAGTPTAQALTELGDRTPHAALARFTEGVAVAIERGTPLADVLRAQAQDAREASKRELMEVAGRREVAMLIPVVFFVLPLVILFALFPGIAVLRLSV